MGYTKLRSCSAFADDMDDAFETTAKEAANRWARWARDRASELSPVARIEGLTVSEVAGSRGRAPGTFKESWKIDRANLKGRVVSSGFYSDDLVAGWIEYGTRPHVIRPRPDRRPASVVETGRARRGGKDPQAALRFYVGGRAVYARFVNHPGTKGQFIAHRVVQEGIPVIEMLLREELRVHMAEAA